MIVYFDTVRRKRPVKEGGELVQLDWSSKKVIKQLPIFPTAPDIDYDPNPRGNSRGGKGMLISHNELFVGTYHTILVFDHRLNLKRRITNNLFVNLHEMCFDGGEGRNIWVSSTAVDCAVLVNQRGETITSWWPGEEKVLQERCGLWPMEIDKNADNRAAYIHAEMEKKEGHTHLNSVTKFQDRTYVLLNRQGMVVQIEPTLKIVLEDQRLCGAHSPAVLADGEHMIVCSSFNKDILIYRLEKATLSNRIHLADFAEIARLHRENPDQPYNKSIFVRGLEIIDSRRILAGVSPASVLEIDILENRLLDFYQYSREVGDAVHGLVHWKT
jgi:hypothetical protein